MSLATSRRFATGKENVASIPVVKTVPARLATRAGSNPRARPALATKTAAASAPGVATTSTSSATPHKGKSAALAASPALNSAVKSSISALAAFGLTSVAEDIKSIFSTSVPEQYGADYSKIISKKPSKKPINVSFKDHDALVKLLIDETKEALVDVVSRRDRAIEAARAFELSLSHKMEEYARLNAQMQELQRSKTAAENQVAELKRQLDAARKETAAALANESDANQEIDEANNMIAELQSVTATLEERVRKLEEEKRDADAINQGLEDDKDEMQQQVAHLEAQLAEVAEKHELELGSLRQAVQADVIASKVKISELTEEVATLTCKLALSSSRLEELQKSASFAEIDVAKIRAERDTAVEAKHSLQSELERNRRQQDASQTSLMTAMENFNRTQELHMQRERDLAKQVEGQLERIQCLSTEREALRAAETVLRADLREVTLQENKLSAELTRLQQEHAHAKNELQAAQAESTRLERELTDSRSALEKLQSTFASTKEELDGKIAYTTSCLSAAEDKLKTASEAEKTWESKNNAWLAEREELLANKGATEDTMAKLNMELETLRESAGATEESQLEKLCQVSAEAEGLRRRVREMQELKMRLAAAEKEVGRLKEDAFEGEIARRGLHNLVQELRGNIRVYVRVRPTLTNDHGGLAPTEDAEELEPELAAQLAVACSPDGTSLELMPPAPRGSKEGFTKRELKPASFSFDTVFGPRSTQEDVFRDVQHLVQSSLDGYNVCLFSYGQTGSGKTHTMQGGAGEHAGLIPRSVKQILETSVKLAGQGWKYQLEVSFLEIYNENIRDLLRAVKPGEAEKPLTIHQDADGNVDVPGLTRVTVSSSDSIDGLLALAAKRRSVAATNMNEVSSRSHQVFTLYLRGEHAGKGIVVKGTLNLCDLAGSERLSKSGAEGDRKKETAAINKSLSCLADVFTALAKKTAHVPFRNSKLTQLLQSCFRGDGKTLMLVNLSPTAGSAHETLCSLRFAAQVSQVELGKPKRRVVDALPAAPPDEAKLFATSYQASADTDATNPHEFDMHVETDLEVDDMENATELHPLDACVKADVEAHQTVSVGSKRPLNSSVPAGTAAKRPATSATVAAVNSSQGLNARAAASSGLRRSASTLSAPIKKSSGTVPSKFQTMR